MPQTWRNATIIPILKSGDVMDCINYRGVLLLHVIHKMAATLIKIRLKAVMEPQIGGIKQDLEEGGEWLIRFLQREK